MDLADMVNDALGWALDLWEGYGWWIVIVGIALILFITSKTI